MKINNLNKQSYLKPSGTIKAKVDKGPLESVTLGSANKAEDFLKLGKLQSQTASLGDTLDNNARIFNAVAIGATLAGVSALAGAPIAAVVPLGIAGTALGALATTPGVGLGAVAGAGITSGLCILGNAGPAATIVTSGIIGAVGGGIGAIAYECG